MKKLILAFIILLSISLSEITVFASTEVPSDYIWKVTFDKDIDAKSVGEYNVYVIDGRYVMIEDISVSVNKNVITIKPSANGYSTEWNNYILRFSEVKTKDGKLINKEIKFTIKEEVNKETATTNNKKNTVIKKETINKKNTVITQEPVVKKEFTDSDILMLAKLDDKYESRKKIFNVTQVAKKNQEKVLNWTKIALSKYPKHILDENIGNVYLYDKIVVNGVNYGGTYLDNDIFIYAGNTSLIGFEKLIHAEFSSILLHKYSGNLNKKKWLALNTKGFEYYGSGNSFLKDKQTGNVTAINDAEYHSKGFLTQYATSTMENDFNSIVRAMFAGDTLLWKAVSVEENYILTAKLDLAIDFYNKLDPMFTRAYFMSLQ